MSEISGIVESILLATQDTSSQFAADARASRQIAERMSEVHKQIDATGERLRQAWDAANTMLRMLDVEVRSDEELEGKLKQRQAVAANLAQVAGDLLTGSDNEHAHDAVADLKNVEDAAGRSVVANSNVITEVKSVQETVAAVQEGIGNLASTLTFARNHSERAALSSGLAAASSDSASRHSLKAVEDLVAYKGDIR